MVEKPKTYAQQAQELKDQLAQKDEQLNEALQRLSFVEEMQNEIAHLREKLTAAEKVAKQSGVSDKTQLTDAIQRAESAEQGLRNSQAKIRELEAYKESLETQLNVQAIQRDSEAGKDKKVNALEEVIKGLNFQVAKLQNRITQGDPEKDARIANLEKELGAERSRRTSLATENLELGNQLYDKIKEIESMKNEFVEKVNTIYNKNQELHNTVDHLRTILNNIRQTASGA